MTNFDSLTSAQLKRAADIKDKIDGLTRQLNAILGGPAPAPAAKRAVKMKRGVMSAAGRARIAAAQRARWAKIKASKRG